MVYGLFDSDQFGVKLASLIFGLLSIFVFYKLCKKIFVSQKIALYSTAFFALLFGSPILEGNIANAENFMILPILTSALIILSLRENDTIKTQNRNILIVFFSGILLGLAFLFKIVAMFDFAAFFIFLALFADEKFLTHIKNKRYQAYEVKKVLSAKRDRKSTRLNSSHQIISYAVFCLKKKKTSTTSTEISCQAIE